MANHLPAVVARRDAQQKIEAILRGLPPDDRRFVLENLLDAIYSAAPSEVRSPDTASSTPTATGYNIRNDAAHVVVTPLVTTPSLADQIVAWCNEHPTVDGVYTVQDAARALLPTDKTGTSKIYSAVVRSSPQSDRTPPRRPRFVWMENSRFKLFSEDPSMQ